jgi:hypothetical protein
MCTNNASLCWTVSKLRKAPGAMARAPSSRALRTGQDPAAIARELLKEKARESDFNRRLEYPKLGIV